MITTLENKTIFLKRFGNIKITGNIKIRLASSLTLHLAYRIFGSIRHHTISSVLKISVFEKVGDVVEKRNKMLKKEQGFFFSTSNFLALIILQADTVIQ